MVLPFLYSQQIKKVLPPVEGFGLSKLAHVEMDEWQEKMFKRKTRELTSFRNLFLGAYDEATKYVHTHALNHALQHPFYLDIDDTVLQKQPVHTAGFKQPKSYAEYEYRAKIASARINKAKAEDYYPAIPRAKKFIQFLDEMGARYGWVTARKESTLEATLMNLQKEGLLGKGFTGELHMQPESESDFNIKEFKQNTFQRLESQHGGILGTMGDNNNDLYIKTTLNGEKNHFKLPWNNTLYSL